MGSKKISYIEKLKTISFGDKTKDDKYYKQKKFRLSDKEWEKDIKSRKVLPDGRIARVDGKGRIKHIEDKH